MKKFILSIALLIMAIPNYAQITVGNPTGYAGNVTAQTFAEELGNYTATQFNSLSGTYLVNFDDAAYTGQTISSVLYDQPTSGFNYRVNFGLLSGGFGRITVDGTNFVSSPTQALTWANGSGATIEFPDIAWGASNENQDIYGVGFTIARLEAPMTISFFSDAAGSNQIGSSLSLSANSTGSGYSFVGIAGNDQIRRVELLTSTNGFSIDDVIVAVSPIPEPSTLIMLLIGAGAMLPLHFSRRKK